MEKKQVDAVTVAAAEAAAALDTPPEFDSYEVGSPVRIKQGPLTGAYGKITELDAGSGTCTVSSNTADFLNVALDDLEPN